MIEAKLKYSETGLHIRMDKLLVVLKELHEGVLWQELAGGHIEARG